MEKRWAEAAESQKEDAIKQGHADDGTYIIVETDLNTGMQTVVCMPHDNNEIMKFVHPLVALKWVDDWGEAGFGYLVFKAVDGRNGTHSAEDISRRKLADQHDAAGGNAVADVE
jgi:hypothetical protein